MKTTYRIGFFLGIFFLLFLLGIGFQWSYQYAREKSTPIPSVQAEGSAKKNEGYLSDGIKRICNRLFFGQNNNI